MRTKVIGLIAAAFLAALPFASDAQVSIGVSVNVAPPPLPVYEQPGAPRPRLHLGTGLLVMERRGWRLLLGAGHLGGAA